MLRGAGVLLAAAVVAAVALRGPPAAACGACQDDLSTRAPAFRREPLPANAVVLVAGKGLDAGSISVTGALDGGVVHVPFAFQDGHDTAGSVFVRLAWPGAVPGQVTVSSNLGPSTFDIGPRQDQLAPEPPVVTARSEGRADACCANRAVSVAATGGLDDDGTVAAVLKLAVSSGAGRRVALFAYRPGTSEALGGSAGGCLATDPGAFDREAIEVTASVLDWAGNESAPVGPFALTYRAASPGGCPGGSSGCGIPAHGGGPLAWLALLGLGLARRRS